MEQFPIVIDIEASGFGRGSYPIEVGVVMPDGKTHCRLLRPEPDWTHWSQQAEQVHGISRDILFEHGHEVREVALFLNELLCGQVVYSDAWGNDQTWLGRLFDAVGLWPSFRLETLRVLIREDRLIFWESSKAEVLKDLNITRHRASNDALILQKALLKTITAEQMYPA